MTFLKLKKMLFLFDLILYVPVNIQQSFSYVEAGSFWVEPVLSSRTQRSDVGEA